MNIETLERFERDNEGRESRPASGPKTTLLAVALCVLAAAVWSFGLAGPYHFDDFATPLGDPASHSLSAWSENVSVTLRPVTKLTYALEADAGLERNPSARRALSIALHGASGVLLFLLIRRLEPRLAPHGAALLAAIWLVHPVHAESILAVSGRTAALSGLLLLAALLALERRDVLLCAGLFFAACLSRETALAGALPLAVLEAGREARSESERRARRAAAWLLAAAAVTALAWFASTPRYRYLADFSFRGRPWWTSFARQVGAVPFGLGLLVEPSRLSIDYGVPLPMKLADPLAILGLIAYAGAVVALVPLVRRSRCTAVGLALWLAALLPTQSVIPKLDPLTNRPLGFALAGILVALAPVCAMAGNRFASRWVDSWGRGAAVALVAVLGVAAVARARLYGSELALWTDAAAKSLTNARPHVQVAILLEREGRSREALSALARAREIDPFSSGIEAMWDHYRRVREEP